MRHREEAEEKEETKEQELGFVLWEKENHGNVPKASELTVTPSSYRNLRQWSEGSILKRKAWTQDSKGGWVPGECTTGRKE